MMRSDERWLGLSRRGFTRAPGSRARRHLAHACVGARAGRAGSGSRRADLSAAGRNAEAPAVAVDPQGDAAAVWYRSNGKNDIVQSSIRPAGGAWEEPVAVSEEGIGSFVPEVAFDAHGDATAIWEQEGLGVNEEVIQSSARIAGSGGWEKPVQLVKGGESHLPHLAVNEAGAAVAVWKRFKGSETAVLVAARPSASGAWQTPVRLEEGDEPAVAIDPAGDAVAVWAEVVEEIGVIVASYRLGATGTWGAPIIVSAKEKGKEGREPQVAIDGKGNAIAVWHYYNGSIRVVQSAIRPAASGIWQEPVRLSAAGVEALEPKLAVDPQGDAVAVWERLTGVDLTIQAAFRPAAIGAWQEPANLSAKDAFEPDAAIDPRGDAVAVWQRNNGSTAIVEAAARPAASGAWGEPASLSAVGEDALESDTAVDQQGNAVAAWQRSDGKHTIVQSAGYDDAGPLLLGVSIPATGVAGQPLSFSVSPFDVWSAIGSTGWSFGDGTSATGASVSHTYAAAGTYPVALSSADVLGNPTSASGSVTIVPAGAAPSPTPAPRPSISGARLTNRRFRVAKSSTATSAKKAPLGTSFRFALSSAAKVQILITTTATGLRRGHICVAPTARLRRTHAKRCTRTLRLGTLARASERQGLDAVAFSGRIGRRPLAVGSYKATLTASSAAGRSAPVTLSFVVVR